MSKFTVKFGAGNTIDKDFAPGTTVGDIIEDEALQSVLGFGDNVEGVIGGTAVGEDYEPSAGSVLSLRTRANTKG